jgi:hypothetical protein
VKDVNKSKDWNCAVVGIIPGPKKPPNVRPHLENLVDDFCVLSSKGMDVDELYTDESGSLTRQRIHHRVFLGSVLADTPARADLGGYRGCNAKRGACHWCRLEGATAPGTSTARFRAYLKPVGHSE